MNAFARDPLQIGAAIRRVRKQAGLTQRQLGAKAGLRQESISLVENGNPAVRIDSLLAIIAALDLELQIAPRSRGWDPESTF